MEVVSFECLLCTYRSGECVDHCMAGFEGRRFTYLGLFNAGKACEHLFIPADKVTNHIDSNLCFKAFQVRDIC